MTLAHIYCLFYKQGIPEHEFNEMVVCHGGMTDKTDDETKLHIPSGFLSGM